MFSLAKITMGIIPLRWYRSTLLAHRLKMVWTDFDKKALNGQTQNCLDLGVIGLKVKIKFKVQNRKYHYVINCYVIAQNDNIDMARSDLTFQV